MPAYLKSRYWLNALFEWRFLAALERGIPALVPHADRTGIRREIRRQSSAIYAENLPRAVDEPGRWHLALAALVLASYRVLFPIAPHLRRTALKL